jgi:hypothetical protein
MGNQNDILKRVKLLMGYDTSMTLNENILVLEQNPNAKYLDPNYTNRGNVKAGSDHFASMQMQQKQKISMIQFCENPKNSAKCKKLKETPNVSIWEATVDNVVKDLTNTATIGKNLIINLSKGDLSAAFTDLRDFMVDTYSGAFVDIFVSVAGVEVGGPLLMEALEIAFLANDLMSFLGNKSGNRDKSNYTTSSGWMWQFQNNIDFQRTIVDLVVVATRGVIRSAPKAFAWLKKTGSAAITTLLESLSKVKGLIGKLGVVGKFLSDKITTVQNFLNKLMKGLSEKTTTVVNKTKEKVGVKPKTGEVAKSTGKFHRRITYKRLIKLFKNKKLANLWWTNIHKVPKKIPEATIAGAFAVLAQAGMMLGLERLLADPKTPEKVSLITDNSYDSSDVMLELLGNIKNDTPNLKNAKKIKFVKQIEDGNEIYLIDGKYWKWANFPDQSTYQMEPVK